MSINKNNVVFLFPGQGAQYQGMALDYLNSGSASVRKLFQTAGAVCGNDMEVLLRDSDAETLKRTDVSQPTVTLANLAASVYLAEQGYSPIACAGFSLGEYAALASAGLISMEDCLRLVRVRGEAMQKSCDRLREAAGGDATAAPGMAAVIGLASENVEKLIAEWKIEDLYAANINSPKQVAVSGTARALAEAETRFKEAGARRVIRLQVAGPFHCPLLADAAESFRSTLESITFNDPKIPLYSNVTGSRINSGAQAKDLALKQIVSPVRWVDEEAAIAAFGKTLPEGIAACLEAGPGKVLQGLWRDSGGEAPCYGAGTIEEISKIGVDA
jgi:[acyl-carrier-protein] S-malonyltransferase